MASGIVKKGERLLWAAVILCAMMCLVFFILHVASGAPLVGGAASTTASLASGSAYGY